MKEATESKGGNTKSDIRRVTVKKRQRLFVETLNAVIKKNISTSNFTEFMNTRLEETLKQLKKILLKPDSCIACHK